MKGRPPKPFECVDCGTKNRNLFYKERKGRCIVCNRVVKRNRYHRVKHFKTREQHSKDITEYMLKVYT